MLLFKGRMLICSSLIRLQLLDYKCIRACTTSEETISVATGAARGARKAYLYISTYEVDDWSTE